MAENWRKRVNFTICKLWETVRLFVGVSIGIQEEDLSIIVTQHKSDGDLFLASSRIFILQASKNMNDDQG